MENGDGYETSESYAVLGFIGLIFSIPLLVVFYLFVWPMVMAYLYITGWWTP
jgi:hypothetical protein